MSAHQVLGIRSDASEAEIRQRYRELARTCHPDRGGDAREFIRLQNAYQAMLEAVRNPTAPDASSTTSPVEESPSAHTEEPRSRPSWMDEVPEEPRWRGTSRSEPRNNLHGNAPVRDDRFMWLGMGTLFAAIGVTFAACVKGAPLDLGAVFGQIILYSIICMVCSAGAAAVGAGYDDDSFVKTYLWVLVCVAGSLIVVVPLPMHRPNTLPEEPVKMKVIVPKQRA
jgi:hypothetical protein